MDQQDERIRGADAARILEEPLLKEALATIEQNIVNKLAQADTRDDDRIRLSLMLSQKRAFERYLQGVMTTGKMAELEMQRRSV